MPVLRSTYIRKIIKSNENELVIGISHTIKVIIILNKYRNISL